VRGFGDPTAITLPDGKPVWYQPDPKNHDGYELPFHLDTVNSQDQNPPTVPTSQTRPAQEPGTRPPVP